MPLRVSRSSTFPRVTTTGSCRPATAGPQAPADRRSLPEQLRELAGVSPQLVRRVREALDAAGFDQVRIVASGGFDAERIAAFEAAGVPVDAYGVGSALLAGRVDFTA